MTGTLVENSDGTPFFDPSTSGSPGMNTEGPSAAIGAAVSLINALENIALQSQIQSGVSALKPALNSSILSWADTNPSGQCYDPSSVGCIIEIVIWKMAMPVGMAPTYGFVGVYQGSNGLDYQSALKATQSQGSLVPSGAAVGGNNSTLQFMYTWYEKE